MRRETARSRRGEHGYTMVAIVMFIAILTILIAAVAPSISTIMRREREEELLFRGKQYARAIAIFRRRYGRFPNSLKEMMEHRPRAIRKLWKDPMCDCDDWKLLIVGQPESTPFLDETVEPGNRPPATYGNLFRTPTPGKEETVGPIMGVRSKVHKQALREWRGRRFYDEWRFIVNDADSDLKLPLDPNTLRDRRRLTPGRQP